MKIILIEYQLKRKCDIIIHNPYHITLHLSCQISCTLMLQNDFDGYLNQSISET